MRLILILGLALAPVNTLAKPKATLCDGCNVVIIALDAIQAKHVGHLGYERNTTPNLDAFAKQAVSFKQAISPSSWTVPTYLSIFTSTYPSQHGLVNRYEKYSRTEKKLGNALSLNPQIMTMAHVLKNNGYQTAGFTGDSGVSAVLGYNNGFDIYTEESAFGSFANSMEHAKKWFAQKKDNKPYFAFIHGYDSHSQGQLPEDLKFEFLSKNDLSKFKPSKDLQAKLREKALAGEELKVSSEEINIWRSWYDSKIRYADEQFGRFLEFLRSQKDYNKTIVIVLSDHGTEFFEHGRVDHGYSLYDELLNVPFMIRVPTSKIQDRIFSEQISTLDTLPTVLSLIGKNPSKGLKDQMVGQDLSSAFTEGKINSRDIFSETDYRNYAHLRSIRTTDGYKYIINLHAGSELLFDLNKDSGEKNNLSTTDLKKVKELKSKLMNHVVNELRFVPSSPLRNDCVPVYQGQCAEK